MAVLLTSKSWCFFRYFVALSVGLWRGSRPEADPVWGAVAWEALVYCGKAFLKGQFTPDLTILPVFLLTAWPWPWPFWFLTEGKNSFFQRDGGQCGALQAFPAISSPPPLQMTTTMLAKILCSPFSALGQIASLLQFVGLLEVWGWPN